MIGIVLALLAALAYSLGAVLVKMKLYESHLISIVLILTVVGNIIFWPLALMFTNLGTVDLEGVLFFVIAGILGFGIGRLLYYKGMEVMGVSVNATIFATYPMCNSILAVLFLGESLHTKNWIGIICILVGVIYIERRLSNPNTGSKRILKKGLVFPLLASLIAAVSFIVRKHGLNIYDEPLLGVAIGYSLSFLFYLLLLIFSNTMRDSLSLRRDFRLFCKAGTCLSLAWMLTFFALRHERVSIVTSLIQTQPLFVLLFAYIYLKEIEHISFKFIICTVLVVIGAVLVSIR